VDQPSLRIGVFGGTFDPIHIGHLAAASEVHSALALDRMLLVPADVQPFKSSGDVTPAVHRLEMARLAVADDPRLEISDVDVVRGAPTFAVDTLSDIAAMFPGSDMFFVAGVDALQRLDEWKEPDRLRSMATFVGVTRPGYSLTSGGVGATLVEVPALPVSSTDVRARVQSGQPVRYLVPGVVADYIQEHKLYRGGADD